MLPAGGAVLLSLDHQSVFGSVLTEFSVEGPESHGPSAEGAVLFWSRVPLLKPWFLFSSGAGDLTGDPFGYVTGVLAVIIHASYLVLIQRASLVSEYGPLTAQYAIAITATPVRQFESNLLEPRLCKVPTVLGPKSMEENKWFSLWEIVVDPLLLHHRLLMSSSEASLFNSLCSDLRQWQKLTTRDSIGQVAPVTL